MSIELSSGQLSHAIECVFPTLEGSPLSKSDVLEIQESVLSENNVLSPMKLLSFERDDPESSKCTSATFVEVEGDSVSIYI